VKPMGTEDLLRQIEALLVQHEDNKIRRTSGRTPKNNNSRSARKSA
jgi:hypothetical protein